MMKLIIPSSLLTFTYVQGNSVGSLQEAFNFVTLPNASTHGCHCAGFATGGSMGGRPIDDLDRQCKVWKSARKCLTRGVICDGHKQHQLPAYTADSFCDHLNDPCEKALCDVDMAYANTINAMTTSEITAVNDRENQCADDAGTSNTGASNSTTEAPKNKCCLSNTYFPFYFNDETHRCSDGQITVTCEEGLYARAGETTCSICPVGKKCAAGTTTPVDCEDGEACPEGTGSPEVCSAGTHAYAGDISCSTCPTGFKCPEGTGEPIECAANESCPAGTGCTEEETWDPISESCSTDLKNILNSGSSWTLSSLGLYVHVSATDMTWLDAIAYCQGFGEGSELAMPASAEENVVFMNSITAQTNSAPNTYGWYGFHRFNAQDTTTWNGSDRRPVNWFGWCDQRPNNYQNNERCVVPLPQISGCWEDIFCTNLYRATCTFYA